MAITGTQSTASILASNAASNRIREQQAMLAVPEKGVNLNASNPIGLISQGLSGAANALSAGDRRAAAQTNLDNAFAAQQAKQQQTDTLFGQGQEDRRAKIAGQNAQIESAGPIGEIDTGLNKAKGAANKQFGFRTGSPELKEIDSINNFYETAPSGAGVIVDFLETQPKELRESSKARQNIVQSYNDALSNITTLDKFAGVSPAILQYGANKILKDTEIDSAGWITDGGDFDSGKFSEQLIKQLPNLIKLDGLANEHNKLDLQANNAKAKIQLGVAQAGVSNF